MMKRIFIIFFTSLVCFQAVLADDNPGDSARVWSWFDAFLKSSRTNQHESKKYLDSIQSYLQRNPEQVEEKAEFDKMLGIYYYRNNKIDSSIIYYNRARNAYKQQGKELEQAKILVNLSLCFNRKSAYEKTITYAVEALKIFEKLGDRKGISIANNIIGQVYFFTDDFENARKYFRKYLANAQAANDSVEMGGGYNNLGSVFMEEGRYDSALFYHKKSIVFAEKTKNLYSLSNAYQNIASVYQKQSRPQQSLAFYEKALDISKELEDENAIAMIKLNIGKNYNDQHKFKQALPFLEESLQRSQALENKQLIKDNLQSLSIAWEGLHSYQKSLEYYKLYDTLSDSLLNEENKKNIEEINVKYETEKKDRRIEQQSASLKEKDLTIQRNIGLIIGLFLLVILVSSLYYFMHNRYRLKQEALMQKEKAKMKSEQIKAVVESQEDERQRFASDLHDGMGQLISALALNIQSMHNMRKQNAGQTEELSAHSIEILDEIHDEIRSIAFNLMPRVLVNEGLIEACKSLARRINKSGAINIRVGSFDVKDRFQEKSAISLYRVIQEFLSNIIKYAHAKNVDIQFTAYDLEIILTIEDDGSGYDVEEFKESDGNGWRNINTRMELLNADIEIDSMAGRKNTTVSIHIPKNGNVKL